MLSQGLRPTRLRWASALCRSDTTPSTTWLRSAVVVTPQPILLTLGRISTISTTATQRRSLLVPVTGLGATTPGQQNSIGISIVAKTKIVVYMFATTTTTTSISRTQMAVRLLSLSRESATTAVRATQRCLDRPSRPTREATYVNHDNVDTICNADPKISHRMSS